MKWDFQISLVCNNGQTGFHLQCMKIVNQKYQPMIMEKRYFKSGNSNLIEMNKNELQTLNNLTQPRSNRGAGKNNI
jgi:hypothetical protein